MLTSTNHITKPNLLQLLKVIRKSTTFNLSAIHLLAKSFVDSGPAKPQTNWYLPFSIDGSVTQKRFVWAINPGYGEYTIYGQIQQGTNICHSINGHVVTNYFAENTVVEPSKTKQMVKGNRNLK